MESKRRIILVLTVAAIVVFTCLSCSVAQDNDDNSRNSSVQRMQRPGDERPGPRSGERNGRRGPDRGQRGGGPRPGRPEDWRRELTDEQIDRVLEELKKRDPNTAKELAVLRKKEPEKFRYQLRRSAGQEIGSVIMQNWTERRQEEFLGWLEKYVPNEAEELAKLKEKEPELYTQKYDITRRRYSWIYERTRRNPELAKVLVADLHLMERQRELQRKYRAAEAEEDKKEIMAELEEVVSDRYEFIVQQKQMEYEQLLKRLEALQNDVKARMEEIKTWRTEEYKEKIVKERLEELTTERRRGPWG